MFVCTRRPTVLFLLQSPILHPNKIQILYCSLVLPFSPWVPRNGHHFPCFPSSFAPLSIPISNQERMRAGAEPGTSRHFRATRLATLQPLPITTIKIELNKRREQLCDGAAGGARSGRSAVCPRRCPPTRNTQYYMQHREEPGTTARRPGWSPGWSVPGTLAVSKHCLQKTHGMEILR